MIKKLSEILEYKELLINLTLKELKLKYKNSALGFLWSFLNPLMLLVVYTFAFKYVFRNPVKNFTVFLLAGLLPWTFLQAAIQSSTNSIVSNANLIKKVYFPREIIPLSTILSNFINFIITLSILFLAIIVFKVKVGIGLILLPAILLLLLIFIIGLALGLSALNVIYRDVSHFVEILFMGWFYVTPIVYSIDLIPKSFRWLLYVNPMALIVESLRAVLVYNKLPSVAYLMIIIIYDVFFMLIGSYLFRKNELEFAEEI